MFKHLSTPVLYLWCVKPPQSCGQLFHQSGVERRASSEASNGQDLSHKLKTAVTSSFFVLYIKYLNYPIHASSEPSLRPLLTYELDSPSYCREVPIRPHSDVDHLDRHAF